MFKHMQVGSKSYPEVNFKDLLNFFMKLQSSADFGEGEDELGATPDDASQMSEGD